MTFRLADPDPAQFAAERARLFALVRPAVPFADVLEVGSTAVPGVIGKGDLDVLVRCDEADFPRMVGTLDAILTFNPQQFHSAIYRGYVLESPLDLAVQATVRGGPHDVFEAFLEALQDPTTREAYNALKREWDGRNMDAYRSAKSAFIERVLP